MRAADIKAANRRGAYFIQDNAADEDAFGRLQFQQPLNDRLPVEELGTFYSQLLRTLHWLSQNLANARGHPVRLVPVGYPAAVNIGGVGEPQRVTCEWPDDGDQYWVGPWLDTQYACYTDANYEISATSDGCLVQSLGDVESKSQFWGPAPAGWTRVYSSSGVAVFSSVDEFPPDRTCSAQELLRPAVGMNRRVFDVKTSASLLTGLAVPFTRILQAGPHVLAIDDDSFVLFEVPAAWIQVASRALTGKVRDAASFVDTVSHLTHQIKRSVGETASTWRQHVQLAAVLWAFQDIDYPIQILAATWADAGRYDTYNRLLAGQEPYWLRLRRWALCWLCVLFLVPAVTAAVSGTFDVDWYVFWLTFGTLWSLVVMIIVFALMCLWCAQPSVPRARFVPDGFMPGPLQHPVLLPPMPRALGVGRLVQDISVPYEQPPLHFGPLEFPGFSQTVQILSEQENYRAPTCSVALVGCAIGQVPSCFANTRDNVIGAAARALMLPEGYMLQEGDHQQFLDLATSVSHEFRRRRLYPEQQFEYPPPRRAYLLWSIHYRESVGPARFAAMDAEAQRTFWLPGVPEPPGGRAFTKQTCFIKRELGVPKPGLPRCIENAPLAHLAATGWWYHGMQERMSRAFSPVGILDRMMYVPPASDFSAESIRRLLDVYVYAPGHPYEAFDDLGLDLHNAFGGCGEDYEIDFWAIDYSKWDARLAEQLLKFENSVLFGGLLPADLSFFAEFNHEHDATFEARGRRYVRARWTGRRRTGGSNTTAGNSSINLGVSLFAFARLRLRVRWFMTGGDDAVISVVVPKGGKQAARDAFTQEVHLLGLIVKLLDTPTPHHVDFFSSRWLPAERREGSGRSVVYRLTPKIFRQVFKLGFVCNPPAPKYYDRYYKGKVECLSHSCGHAPVLGELLRHHLSWFPDVVAAPHTRQDLPFLKSFDPVHACAETYAAFEALYGFSARVLERRLLALKRGDGYTNADIMHGLEVDDVAADLEYGGETP